MTGQSREKFPAVRRGGRSMASAIQKITLTSSRDIPFSQLTLVALLGLDGYAARNAGEAH
jgi:hypothetical protein